MQELYEKIAQIDFNYRTQELVDQLEESFELISQACTVSDKQLLRKDFNLFIERGRFILLQTFAGGIIFLREPETIEYILVDFSESQQRINFSVRYQSDKRNTRNVKYKPNAGQVESSAAGISAIFPHFFEYEKNIQTLFLLIVAKIIKKICEHHKRESWFMKYEQGFPLSISIDSKEILKFEIEA
jgi:hypothetical protein